MMIDLTIASFLVSLLGFVGLYNLYVDRVIIYIKSIVPGISGVKEGDKEWKHSISGIQVEVLNKGKRDAQNCEGLVTFKKMDSLTLYPTEKGNVLGEAKFNLHAGERKNLVAARKFSGAGIDGSAGLEMGEFLEKAPPIEVVIYYGEKKIRKRLSEKDVEKILRRNEEDAHMYG
ncbi:hypothetical protein [Methanosarcina sp. 2.H.A.1B.4]|uniref:hypothetical protein n=1 Tax=Methanosarcina sp. 2.H.A.1B.4 TaxID=1483600 RepID=UPI00062169F0|nr:hypothetical protein [Methanosarcina sp. 2.H.A.1B.4]KKG08764.1 hypothetical protein EO92_13125 [Methanosarcina sp. 2.H.A.1B.4]